MQQSSGQKQSAQQQPESEVVAEELNAETANGDAMIAAAKMTTAVIFRDINSLQNKLIHKRKAILFRKLNFARQTVSTDVADEFHGTGREEKLAVGKRRARCSDQSVPNTSIRQPKAIPLASFRQLARELARCIRSNENSLHSHHPPRCSRTQAAHLLCSIRNTKMEILQNPEPARKLNRRRHSSSLRRAIPAGSASTATEF